jgi:superfamily II DNA/RNA helicase
VESESLAKIDFLKVEAEGAEPEVLSGLCGLNIPKIVVFCSPKCNVRSPVSEVADLLVEFGYRIVELHHDNTNSLLTLTNRIKINYKCVYNISF